MHIIFREQRHLDEEAAAIDLGQSPADVVVLSFSDADLGAMATAWQGMGAGRPGLRLANLAQLRHPLSVDLYVEKVLSGAKTIVIRLLGGLDYWRYGVEEVAALSRARGINLAILAGDATVDARLTALSTVPPGALAALDGYLRAGGPANCRHALQLVAALAGLGATPADAPAPMPEFGEHMLPESTLADDAPLAVLVFYRSHALSGDIAPITAMAQALTQRGLRCRAVFVDSLKAPGSADFIRATLRRWRPAVVLNATGFSARGADSASPLDAGDCPVLQLVLAASTRAGWAQSARGLSPADMAMQMVLPECDGRLMAGAISFKTPDAPVPGLEFTRTIHQPDGPMVAMAAERAAGWARLATTPPGQRRLAVVLSDYPGAGGAGGDAGQIGYAVGLDSFASLERIIALLAGRGYDIPANASARPLQQGIARACITLVAYEAMFGRLPVRVQAEVRAAWGSPAADPSVRNGAFHLVYQRLGKLLVAVQPERGWATARRAEYHDPDLPPCHGYIAFYLWLRQVECRHALVHLGAHGTLEWLPGKALAPGPECTPGLLTGGVPVVYPFIVNNPGEAMAARRRLGAVVLGHLTPPLKSAGAHGPAAALERLLEDYAAADGLDRRRTGLLRQEILQLAEANGLLAECGIASATPQDDALARLDAYLCDVKELQIRDGLHVFGTPPSGPAREALLSAIRATSPGHDVARALDDCAAAEADALLRALDGKFIAPGPAGAPSRGRADVLPTGRNLFSLDPRATPTRAAMLLAHKTAEVILTRHLQEHGDWPRSIMLDLWASSALRTGGEDLALAFVLMGVGPVWDDGSNRVSGVEILPLAELSRPRVDVTLHISGLFRDAFEPQIQIFNMAVAQLAARGELPGDGARALTRIYGAAPGHYGAGGQTPGASRAALGQEYLDTGCFAYGPELHGVRDAAGFAARVAAADALVHVQDHAEIDLLDGPDFAAFEGGFAAAAALLGGNPALYHADTSRPDAPRVRAVAEEVRRVVRGRAANPKWITGMMRHGYRGAAEISRALDGLYGFAATLGERFDAQFDLIFEATLGDPEVARFLQLANPAAFETMRGNFRQAAAQGLWHSRRNSAAEVVGT